MPIERTAVVREGRPYGPRFGSLVHAALAAVGYDADEEQIAATVALHGRILGAPPDERAAARIAVAAALAHPLVARAAVSADCRREVAVAWRDGERLIEGVADLVFVEADGWTVVDFKTEDDPRSNRRVYEAQLGAYVAAVAAATGQRARGVILSV